MLPEPSRVPVAVAVATIDRPQQLERCIEAVLAGRVLPSELVIVDQSAGDATAVLVEQAGWHDILPVVYVHQARRGLSASRNAAIARASQPIIAFTDDDCVPHRGWLAAIAEAFEDDQRPNAVTGAVLPLGPEIAGLHAVSERTSSARRLFRGPAIPWAVGSGGNTAVRRELLERIDGFDERLGAGSPGLSAEDLDVLYRLLRAGATILYEPGAVMFHEQQTATGLLSRALSYGFGLGAFCGMALRRGDVYAWWILARWAIDRVDTTLRSLLRRQWLRLREEALTLQGGVRGLVHGWRQETAR